MNSKKKILAMVFAVIVTAASSVEAQWFSWESRTGLSSEQVVALASEMGTRGYAPTRIDSSLQNGELKFATIWVKEASLEKEQWQFGVRLSAPELQEHVESIKAKGFAPIDVAVTTVAGRPMFSMISGTGALTKWQSRHGLTAQEARSRTDEYARAGLDLVDINAYPTAEGMRFAAIWGDAGFDSTITTIASTENQFRREVANLPAGFVPLHVNVGSFGDETVYSAVFVKDDSKQYQMRYNISEAELQTIFNELVDAGYAPHAVNSYNIRLQPRYAVVFAKDRPTQVKANPVFTMPDVELPSATRRVLDIPPVYQQKQVWCWLAVGEMVFRHFGVRNNNPAGNFQCGIIGTIMSDTECYTNCFNARCIRPSGSNYATVKMLKDYAWMASKRVFTASETFELPFAAIKANIDAGKPIIAGVSPTRQQYYEGAEHVALIVGYEAGPGGVNVIINDPYPYPPMGNFYIMNGATALNDYQYKMPLRDFTKSLFWHWSIHNISVS